MTKYYSLKVLKDVLDSWRDIKERKNKQRRDLIRIRETLADKPELQRPLLAMKNNLLWRAFNTLFDGARDCTDEELKVGEANTHYYFSRVRKAYLGLKLNKQLSNQETNVNEICDLFMKRRWLGYIKSGTQYLKERRKERH